MRKLTVLSALAFTASLSAASAATSTGNFNVTMTIAASCIIDSPTNMNFGTVNVITNSTNNATATFNVICSNTTPYTLTLNNGLNASVAQRRMVGSSGEFINYNLYTDSAYSKAWTSVPGTGNGAKQPFTIYGQVPSGQATPTPGAYNDTVTISVTY